MRALQPAVPQLQGDTHPVRGKRKTKTKLDSAACIQMGLQIGTGLRSQHKLITVTESLLWTTCVYAFRGLISAHRTGAHTHIHTHAHQDIIIVPILQMGKLSLRYGENPAKTSELGLVP